MRNVVGYLFVGLVLPCMTFASTRVNVRKAHTSPQVDIHVVCLQEFVRTQLTTRPEFRLVDPVRGTAILRELDGGLRDDLTPETFVACFSEYVPIDAHLEVAREDNRTLILRCYTAGKLSSTAIPGTRGRPAWPSIKAGAKWFYSQLGIPDADHAALLKQPMAKAKTYEVITSAPFVRMDWPMNSGETQLKLLLPAWSKDRGNPALAGALLEAAMVQFRSRSREQVYAKKATDIAAYAVDAVVGTDHHEQALLVHPYRPEEITQSLKSVAESSRKFRTGELDDIDDIEDTALVTEEPSAKDETQQRRRFASAQYLLLRAENAEAKEDAERDGLSFASDTDPWIRRIGAQMLATLKTTEAKAAIDKLLADEDLQVAHAAAEAKHQQDNGDQRAKAAWQLLETGASTRQLYKTILNASEQISPASVRPWLSLHHSAARASAVAGLSQAQSLTKAEWQTALADPSADVVLAALAHRPDSTTDADKVMLSKLANSPHSNIANAGRAARQALADKSQQSDSTRAILETAHFLHRFRVIDKLAAAPNSENLALLEEATDNRDFYVRCKALKALVQVAPKRGAEMARRLVLDPYSWARLHAAATLADHAEAKDAALLERVMAKEKDQATRLYLADAIAKATGSERPAPPPAVRSPKPGQTLTWLCGLGEDCADSPYDAYYTLRTNNGDRGRKAYEAGKIIFGRVSIGGNPAYSMILRRSRHAFWQALEEDLVPENLQYLDGVVVGEETMVIKNEGLWRYGWREFCTEAGIDAAGIDGDIKALTKLQRAAFEDWATRLAVEGFNEMYDYIKLKFAKLRPGLQVCTFIPYELGDCAAALDWKFDWAGGYDYKGCNRMAYNQIRRHKTLWPDRPLIWLTLGIGGYEMNPVRRSHTQPSKLLQHSRHRAFADAVSAYIGGAHVGWFSVWIAVKNDWEGTMAQLAGARFTCEDIGGAGLERAIQYAWADAKSDDDKLPPPTEVKVNMIGDDGGDEVTEDDLEGEPDEEELEKQFQARIQGEQALFRRGFDIYQKYLYDGARVFRSLPLFHSSPDVLLIRPNTTVWTRPPTRKPVIPAATLYHQYDFFGDINHAANVDLNRYRMIIVHAPGRLRNETMAALTAWLREHPGILYIHQDLSADNQFAAPQVGDMKPVLAHDWPWENDVQISRIENKQAKPTKPKPQELMLTNASGAPVTFSAGTVASRFKVSGSGDALLKGKQGTHLALWRDPTFKGVVLFDGVANASHDYASHVAEVISQLGKEGIGPKSSHGMLRQYGQSDHLTATASTGYYAKFQPKDRVPGLDVLTGRIEPPIAGGRHGVINLKGYNNKHVLAQGDFVILGEAPLTVTQNNGSMHVQSTGLMRISSTGVVPKSLWNGLNQAPAEDALGWILSGDTPGWATTDDSGNQSVYIRTPDKLTLPVSK